MENKDVIKVGDYVEPVEELNLQDMSDEVLYGFVTNKDDETKTITVKPIGGNGEEHTWKEKYFKKAEVPEYFKDKTNSR